MAKRRKDEELAERLLDFSVRINELSLQQAAGYHAGW
jgi:hypothetical protein